MSSRKLHIARLSVGIAIVMLSSNMVPSAFAQQNIAPSPVAEQSAAPADITTEKIYRQPDGAYMKSLLQSGKAGTYHFLDSAALLDFYSARNFEPLWRGAADNVLQAAAAMTLLQESWTHGLNPDNYNIGPLQDIHPSQRKTDIAVFELLLSDAVLRYGRDMTGMRIDAKELRLKNKYWRQPKAPADIFAEIAAAKNPVDVMKTWAPQSRLYEVLREELVRLSKAEAGFDDLLPMTFDSHHFTPRSKHEDVRALRLRLDVGLRDQDSDPYYYDDELASAVMTFQKQHGLEPDGIIGPRTADILNRTQKDRMEQIVANLERMRWLDQKRPERYILVNIPSQRLWAIENGKVKEQMRVVVGMPWRQTKSYTTDVTGVRINPTWTVPLSIKMEDFLPRLREDPSYLTEKQIDLIRGYGRNAVTLDPYNIDWHAVGWREMGKIRMVQRPGDHNALGRIRILMPSDYNIYLHDTNHPEFFEKEQRLYSSGCIRLSQPGRLAHFIMRGEPDWSEEKMQQLLAEGEMVDIEIEKPFPIYIVYQTMWQDEKGRIVYGGDVYKQDRKLIDLLAEIKGYSFPNMPAHLYAEASGKTLASNQ